MTSFRVVTAVFLLLFSTAASAATRNWVGASSGVWSDPDNWSPAGAPVSGDTLSFPNTVLGLTNDVKGLTLAGLSGGAPGSWLDGKRLTITDYAVLNGWAVNLDITIDGASVSVDGDFGGAFDVSGGTVRFPTFYPSAVIRGPFTGSGTLVNSVRITHDGTFSGTAHDGFLAIDGASLPNLDVNNSLLLGYGTVGAVAMSSGYGSVRPSANVLSDSFSDHTIGTLSMASLSLTSRYYVDVDTNAATSDQLIVGGDVTLSGPLSLSIVGPAPTVGQSFVIIDHGGTAPVDGNFSYVNDSTQLMPLTEGTVFTLSDTYFRITYQGGDGNDVVLDVLEPPASTSIVMNVSPNPVLSGQQVTFTANVSFRHRDGSPAPALSAGIVTFDLNGNGFGPSGWVINGVATATLYMSTQLTYSVSVTAKYTGSSDELVSESDPVTLTIYTVPVTMEAHTSPNPSQAGDPVRLYVTLADAEDASVPVKGYINVTDAQHTPVTGSTRVTSSGTFEVDLKGLSPGQYSFLVEYLPDEPFGRTTQTVSHTINARVLTIDDISVQEGNDQDKRVLIPLHLSAPPEPGHPITVNYRTIAGTARPGEDYVETSGIASISSGTEGTIEVSIYADRKPEPNETFTIELSNPSNAVLGRNSATVTIVDDDQVGPAVISISDVTVAEGNSGTLTRVMLAVTLSAPSTEVVRVAFATIDGTARAREDYEPVSGVVEFAPGETLKDIEVDVIGDNFPEADETFSVVLSDALNATIGVPSAIVVIRNDDQVPPRHRPSRP